MTLDVRPATAADADAIGRVHVETWQVCYRGQIPDEVLDALSVPQHADQWRQRLSAEPVDGAVFVATDPAGVVGFASVGAARGPHALDGAGMLQALYLLPAHWGSGVGRRLLRPAEEWLRDAGFETGTLWVLTANERARRFYESAGWRFDGTEKMYERDGHQIPEVRYVRTLAVDSALTEGR